MTIYLSWAHEEKATIFIMQFKCRVTFAVLILLMLFTQAPLTYILI